MLGIQNVIIQSFYRLKINVMNNKMSIYLLFAFLFVAASCKSEVKSKPSIEDEVSIEHKAESNDNAPKDVREVIRPEENEKIVKEASKPIKGAKEAKKETKVREKNTEPVQKENENPVSKPAKNTETNDDNGSDDTENVKTKRPAKPEMIDKFVGFPKHTLFDALLKEFVTSTGVVDYAGLKSKEAKLDEYLTMLENHPPETTWNNDQELAYWINAYNANTIKLILKNYPVKSITDLHGGKPWDVKWIKLDGKTLSLNNIENDIIRPKYNEPRIHFAVNCAAISCPPLLNRAYSAKSLDAQLESQTKKFINNSVFNTLGKNEIKVSKIFEWYGEDFGDVASFVLRYADKTVKPSAQVKFLEYDWKLNGK